MNENTALAMGMLTVFAVLAFYLWLMSRGDPYATYRCSRCGFATMFKLSEGPR